MGLSQRCWLAPALDRSAAEFAGNPLRAARPSLGCPGKSVSVVTESCTQPSPDVAVAGLGSGNRRVIDHDVVRCSGPRGGQRSLVLGEARPDIQLALTSSSR